MPPILHRFTAHYATFSVGVVVLISCFGAPALWVQAALVTLGVIVFGLPHGAADPIVAWQAGVLRDNTQTTIVLTIYLALMVSALVAWIWSPGISLAFFLLVSAWHFAGDWDVLGNDIDRWVVGISMLSVPALAHADDVTHIFSLLVPESTAIATVSVMFALGVVLTPIAVVLPFKPNRVPARSALPMLATLLLGIAAPPLIFFALYFCFYHSPKQLQGLLGDSTVQDDKRVATVVGVTTLLALPIMLLASRLIRQGEHLVYADWLQFAFVGLFALTLPHISLAATIRWVAKLCHSNPLLTHRTAASSVPTHGSSL